jgi:hypothetical protein
MAVTAIKAVVSHVVLVAERDRLLSLYVDVREIG